MIASRAIVAAFSCYFFIGIVQAEIAFTYRRFESNDPMGKIIQDAFNRKHGIVQEAISRISDQVDYFVESVGDLCCTLDETCRPDAGLIELHLSELSHNYGHETNLTVNDSFQAMDFVVSNADWLMERRAHNPSELAIVVKVLREMREIRLGWQAFIRCLVNRHLEDARKWMDVDGPESASYDLRQLLPAAQKYRQEMFALAICGINADWARRQVRLVQLQNILTNAF